MPKIDNKDWPKTIETIEDLFHSYHGETVIPLGYVIRMDASIPTLDPQLCFTNLHEDIIVRAPHVDAGDNRLVNFQEDNVLDWKLIS